MSFYETTILADNPVAFFRMNENSGTTAFDATGGASATISGVTLNQPSAGTGLSGSFQFTSASSIVEISRNLLTGSAFSVEMWVRSTSWTTRSYLLGHYMSDMSAWIDISTGSGGSLRFRVSGSEGSGDALPSLTLDTWQHLVFTWGADTLKCYLDGVLSATRTISGFVPAVATSGNVNLGSRITTQQPFYGYLDEFAVYDYVLTDAQVLFHFNAIEEPATPPVWMTLGVVDDLAPVTNFYVVN